MALLDEDQAFTLTTAYPNLNPDEQLRAGPLLKMYRQNQEDLNLPLFPRREAERRLDQEKFTNVFNDVNTITEYAPAMNELLASSPNPERTKIMGANVLFMARALNKTPEEVSLTYAEGMPRFAHQVWGKTEVDDNTFYQLAASQVKNGVKVEETRGEATRLALRSAALGTYDSATDYQEWRKTNQDVKLPVQAHTMFSQAYKEAQERLTPYKAIITGAVNALQNSRTGDQPTAGDVEGRVTDAIVDLPPKDRMLVIASIMAGAEAKGESIDKDWTFMQQTGEAFARTLEGSFTGMATMDSDRVVNMVKRLAQTGSFSIEGEVTPESAKAAISGYVEKARALSGADILGTGDTFLKMAAEQFGPGRKFTPEEEKVVLSEINRMERRTQLARQVRNAAVTSDPVKNIFASAIGSSAAMLPIASMGSAGLAISAQMYAGSEYDDLRTKYPTLSADKARDIANISGVVMAGLDKLEVKFLSGKLPSLNKLIQDGVAGSVVKRAGIRTIEGMAFENLQEGAQDLTTPVVQEIMSRVQTDIPQVDWKQEMDNFLGSRGDVFLGTLPLVLIGVGAGSARDVLGIRALEELSDNDKLGQMGLGETDRTAIIDLSRSGDLEGAQTALRAAMVRRDPAIAKQFAAQAEVDQTGTMAFDSALQRGLVPTYTKEGNVHTLAFPDGRVIKANSWEEARWYVEQVAGDALAQDIDSTAELASFFTGQKVEGVQEQVTFTPGEQRTQQQDVEAGLITEDQAMERAQIAAEALGMTPQQAKEATWAVLGRNTTEMKEGVARSALRLFQGANVNTVVEEVVEGRLTAGLLNKRYNRDQVLGWIKMAEQATGETFLTGDSDQSITEAVSAIVVADVIGQRKDGSTLPAGLVTRGLTRAVQQQQSAKGFAAFLHSFRQFFRQVFQRARSIKKAKAEGKLGEDYQGFVDELLGVPRDTREMNAAATQATQVLEGSTPAVEETVGTAPQEINIQGSLALGSIVSFNGYVGRLEQRGERFAVVSPDREVELSSEQLSEVLAENDPAITRQLFTSELAATEPRVGETTFTPAPDGLAIIGSDGVRYVPQNKKLSKNVVMVDGKPAFRILNPAVGRITLLRGQQAQQAIDAMLEAASRVEKQGGKVNYSIAPAAKARDAEYFAAVEAGDMEKAQAMVDEAARGAGYNVGPVFHRTKADFTVFDLSKSSPGAVWGPAIYASLDDGSWNPASLKDSKAIKGYVGGKVIDLTQPSASDLQAIGKLIGREIDTIPLVTLERRYGSVAEGLKAAGFSAALHKGPGSTGNHIAVFDPNQIKSADPVTYDSSGAPIPLSQRFQSTSNDIRYSIAPAKFSENVEEALAKALDFDPDTRRAFYGETWKRIAKVADDVDRMAAADLTAVERKAQQEQFAKNRFNELLAQMPPNQSPGEQQIIMGQARKEAREWAEQNRETAPSERERILGYMRIVNAGLMGFPAELRGKVGGYMKVAQAQSAGTALKAIKSTIEKMGKVIETKLKEDYTAEVKDVLKKGKIRAKAGEKPRSEIGAEATAVFQLAKQAMDLKEVEVLKAIGEREAQLNDPNLNLTIDQRQALQDEINTLDTFGTSKDWSASQAKAAYDTLVSVYETGYMDRLVRRNAINAEVDRLRELFKQGTGITDLERARINAAQGDSVFRRAVLEIGSFNEVIYSLVGEDSEFARELLRMERESDNARADLDEANETAVGAFFTALAGSELKGQKLRFKLATEKTIKAPNGEEFSQLEAISALTAWRQEKGRKHMEGKFDEAGNRITSWGYDQAWVDAVEAQLSNEALAVMAFITQQYRAEYPVLDALMREREGVALPMEPSYAPLSVLPNKIDSSTIYDPVSGVAITNVGLTPPALRSRSSSAVNRPVFRDALQVYLAHSRQMNHWVARYDFARTMQQLFLSQDTLEYVRGVGGDPAVGVLRKWTDWAVQGGVRSAADQFEINNFLVRMAGRGATAAILGRASTIAVQTTQLAAAMMKMPFPTFLRLSAKLYAGQLSWTATFNSAFIQRRVTQKSPLVREATQSLLAQTKPNRIKHEQVRLANLLSEADGFATAATYTLIFHHKLEEAQKLGMGDTEAAAFAVEEADRLTEEVAQPVRQSQRSLMELYAQNNWAAKSLWAFASEPRQKVAMALYSMANKKSAAYKAKLAFLVFGVNGLYVHAIKTGWASLRGTGDDDDWTDWKAWAASALSAPVAGFPGMQALYETGSLFSGPARARGAVQRMIEGESFEDMPTMIRDMELIITGLAVGSDTAAAAAGFMHIASDAAKVIDTATSEN